MVYHEHVGVGVVGFFGVGYDVHEALGGELTIQIARALAYLARVVGASQIV